MLWLCNHTNVVFMGGYLLKHNHAYWDHVTSAGTVCARKKLSDCFIIMLQHICIAQDNDKRLVSAMLLKTHETSLFFCRQHSHFDLLWLPQYFQTFWFPLVWEPPSHQSDTRHKQWFIWPKKKSHLISKLKDQDWFLKTVIRKLPVMHNTRYPRIASICDKFRQEIECANR